MPRNYHEKKVIYESFEGQKEIFATTVNWGNEYLSVHHYPDENHKKFLHEDEVAGLYPTEKQIPLERVYEVEDIEV